MDWELSRGSEKRLKPQDVGERKGVEYEGGNAEVQGQGCMRETEEKGIHESMRKKRREKLSTKERERRDDRDKSHLEKKGKGRRRGRRKKDKGGKEVSWRKPA